MRKSIFTISLSLFIAMLFVACKSDKQSALDDLRTFTEELTANSATYTEQDWKEAGVKYEAIDKRLDKYSDEYTDQEQEEIGRLKGKCFKALANGAMNLFKEKLNDASHQVKGAMEELAGSLDSLDLDGLLNEE